MDARRSGSPTAWPVDMTYVNGVAVLGDGVVVLGDGSLD
jgi:hypothetical protein